MRWSIRELHLLESRDQSWRVGARSAAAWPAPRRSRSIFAPFCCGDRGNLLLYSTTTVHANAPAIEELGGISRHYLNHRHEAHFPSEGIPAPLFVHESEREPVSESYDTLSVHRGTPALRVSHGDPSRAGIAGRLLRLDCGPRW
jgi:hypothetical protein